MTYIKLFISFFKIGLFSFGGGYAMIPLISAEIAAHSWMNELEFIQIIGIAEMTPGPIAVNAATFVGFKTAGILGSICATVGVALPSLLIILFISRFFFKNSKHPLMKKTFYGIRPVIAGLILSAGLVVASRTMLLKSINEIVSAPSLINISSMINISSFVDIPSIIILLIIIGINRWKKIHPLFLIVIAGILGYLSQFLIIA